MMADTPKGQGNGSISGGGESGSNEVPAEEAKAPLVINNQFIKDLSFEAPSVPEIFQKMQTVSPNINVNVNVQARQLVDDIYEVTLHTEAECKTGDSTAFLVELDYAGVFTVNVPSEHLRPILLIECPRLLFPFARHIVANVTRDGGFLRCSWDPLISFPCISGNCRNRPKPRPRPRNSTTTVLPSFDRSGNKRKNEQPPDVDWRNLHRGTL